MDDISQESCETTEERVFKAQKIENTNALKEKYIWPEDEPP
jgi:hypothetical protein